MERFGKVALSIRNLSPEVTMYHMVTTLRPGPFVDSLSKRRATDLDELKTKSDEVYAIRRIKKFQESNLDERRGG